MSSSMELGSDETGQRIVPVLACVLSQLCARNDRVPLDAAHVTKFHALRPPSISIGDYLERIARYSCCSGECFVLSLIFVDRIIQTNQYFLVNSLNVHRLLITAVMLSAKFFDDQYFNNAFYGKVGGVPCREVNALEIEFLFMINFNLDVSPEQYQQYYHELRNHAMTSASCSCAHHQAPRALRAPDSFGRVPHVTQLPREEDDEHEQQVRRQQASPVRGATSGVAVDEDPSQQLQQHQQPQQHHHHSTRGTGAHDSEHRQRLHRHSRTTQQERRRQSPYGYADYAPQQQSQQHASVQWSQPQYVFCPLDSVHIPTLSCMLVCLWSVYRRFG
ncbi:MAG: hypothetical protein MHM6MM_000685 [Cercozoa sp. M6MM]